MLSINDTSSEDDELYMVGNNGKSLIILTTEGMYKLNYFLNMITNRKRYYAKLIREQVHVLLVKIILGICGSSLKISPSQKRLQAFGGFPIKVMGEIKIACRRYGKFTTSCFKLWKVIIVHYFQPRFVEN